MEWELEKNFIIEEEEEEIKYWWIWKQKQNNSNPVFKKTSTFPFISLHVRSLIHLLLLVRLQRFLAKKREWVSRESKWTRCVLYESKVARCWAAWNYKLSLSSRLQLAIFAFDFSIEWEIIARRLAWFGFAMAHRIVWTRIWRRVDRKQFFFLVFRRLLFADAWDIIYVFDSWKRSWDFELDVRKKVRN